MGKGKTSGLPLAARDAPRRRVLPWIGFAWLLGASPGTAQTLVITSWGGIYSESQREAYFDPFMLETGFSIIDDHWGGDLDRVRAMVAHRTYRSHVLDAESSELVVGCAEGILDPIDYSKLSFGPEDLLPGAAHECGVGSIAWSMTLGYVPEFETDAPSRTWSDFWDLERFPGARGLYRRPEYTLEIALMSDGVPAERVYEVLRTPQGLARAFRQLDKIKGNVRWWEVGAHPARMLADAEVVMSSAWSERLYEAIEQTGLDVRIAWDLQIMDYEYWIIPRGHPGALLAHRFIDFASRPERQAHQARIIPYGPVRRGATELIDVATRAYLPTDPENMANVLQVDASFWVSHRERLAERFERWLTSSTGQ